MLWLTDFNKEMQEETDMWARREQEIQRVIEQMDRRCQSGSKGSPELDKLLVQQLLPLLPQDSEGSADILKELQSLADLLWLEAATEETKQRCREAMQSMDNTLEKVFERRHNAEMDLKTFESSIENTWLQKKRASEHLASQRDALTGMSFAMRSALKCHDEQVMRQRALEQAGKHTNDAPNRDDASVSKFETAVQDDDVAVKQEPLKVETNKSNEGALVDTGPLRESGPAYVPVTCEAGASSAVLYGEPLLLSRAGQTDSPASLPMTRPSASTPPQADPAVIRCISLRNDFAAAVQSFTAAQTIEACDNEGASCANGPNCSSCPQLIKAKGKPGQDRHQPIEGGWPSSEALNDEAKEMKRAARAAADHDSDGDEWLLKHHPGSAQHPHNCKACHFQGGLCWKGTDCTFCHLCPKPKRKSKHQRDVDKRRQERYLQVQSKLGEQCCEVLAAIDDSRRQMMSSSEDLKKRVKEAYESQDPVRITAVNQIVTNIQKLVTALAIEEG